MPDAVAVSLKEVGKTFKPKLHVNRRERWQRLQVLLQLCGFGGHASAHDQTGSGYAAEKTALVSITASFKQGTVTGIAGESGCGKSTLLKILAGVMPPSTGEITIHGKVARLLDSDDLDQNLTANDVLLDEAGRKSRKASQLKKMLEFAGLSDFADVPVRKYSTGMRLRLAMASVLCQNADVVLIDDYSAVGDLEFQQKCQERISEMAASGTAVIIASNDLQLLRKLCTEVVWLQYGSIHSVGDSAASSAAIFSQLERNEVNEVTTLKAPVELPCLRLVQASVRDAVTGEKTGFVVSVPLRFRMVVEARSDIARIRLSVTLYNKNKQVLRTVLRDNVSLAWGDSIDANAVLPGAILAPGLHEVELIVEPEWEGEKTSIKLRPALSFVIKADEHADCVHAFSDAKDPVVAAPRLEWTCVAA